ncbi:WG repeat-containing protein [Chryseobacterium formosus]|uniref:WG repeat-containing protein n=1 Tax=Chryseobacterium formosus TaxID=1537363 RepID=A0ABT3XQT5_9FLAO|nr:WG repeat-containing protein [Chryseobacterium formosus]MCX8523892.1 WG repeat-containing protein [Chryseobacterium formosus]
MEQIRTRQQQGEGIVDVIGNGGAKFFDGYGKELFNEVYEYLYGFSDGVALVKQNGTWFYIDKKGKRLF